MGWVFKSECKWKWWRLLKIGRVWYKYMSTKHGNRNNVDSLNHNKWLRVQQSCNDDIRLTKIVRCNHLAPCVFLLIGIFHHRLVVVASQVFIFCKGDEIFNIYEVLCRTIMALNPSSKVLTDWGLSEVAFGGTGNIRISGTGSGKCLYTLQMNIFSYRQS